LIKCLKKLADYIDKRINVNLREKKNDMKKSLTFLYFFLYISIFGFFVAGEIPSGDSLWLIHIIFRVGVLIYLLYHLLPYRPRDPKLLWKIIPICLVILDMIVFWHLGFFSDNSCSRSKYMFLIFILFPITYPSWYLCFKIGYRGKVVRDSNGTAKVTGYYNRIGNIFRSIADAIGTLILLIFTLLFLSFLYMICYEAFMCILS